MAKNDIIVYNFLHLENLSTRMGWVIEALDDVKKLSKQSGEAAKEYWQGQAYDVFQNRVTDMNKYLDKLYEQVSASKSKLDKAIEMEKQNESDILKNTVGELTADNIF